MSEAPLAAWGRHLDDELVDVVPVVLNVGVVVPIDMTLGDVYSPETPGRLLVNKADVHAYAQENWTRWTPVHVWEVPGLRFDTIHGSVVVADRWNDTEFAFLTTKAGRRALKINAPLRNIAGLVHWAEHTPGPEGFPEFHIAAIGWRETDRLTQAMPRHYSTCAADDLEDSTFEWAQEYEDVSFEGVRAVRKAFRTVNSKECRDEAKRAWDLARAASDENDGIDVHAGIAQLERYLDDQA